MTEANIEEDGINHVLKCKGLFMRRESEKEYLATSSHFTLSESMLEDTGTKGIYVASHFKKLKLKAAMN